MILCTQCLRDGRHAEAIWYVWPHTNPPAGGYDYLCTEHVSQALQLGMEVRNPDPNNNPEYVKSPVYEIKRIGSK